MRLGRPEHDQMIRRQRDPLGAKHGHHGMMFVHAHFDVVMEMQTTEGHLGFRQTDKTFPQVIQLGRQNAAWAATSCDLCG